MRSILHIDFDSFFASCEQHFNPNLRGKPIGITAENGRNAVIAASREAKNECAVLVFSQVYSSHPIYLD